jgi:catechol 2,3-dioxygenase-like lactoylglutathione lyase family enzyme
VQVYGCNHVAIEVDDIETAIAFYKDVFNLEQLDEGEGDAFFKLGEHQFLAIFEVEKFSRQIYAILGSWCATKNSWKKFARS